MQVSVLNPFGVEAEVRPEFYPWEVKRVRPYAVEGGGVSAGGFLEQQL